MAKKLFILMVMLLPVLGAQAQQTKEEIQKRQQELQQELAELNNTFAEIKKNKKQSLGQLALVQRKIRAREELISNLNKDLRLIDDNIYLTTLEINRMKRELDTLKQNYAQSLVFAYKNRSNYDYLNFIFSATSFNDAIKRMAYLKSYRQYRETQADNIIKTQQVLQQKAGYLTNSKNEKNNTLKEQGKQLKVLEDDKKEKDQVVRSLKERESDVASEIKNKARMQARLRQALQTIIKKEIAEAKKREQERLAREEADRKRRLAEQEQQRKQAAAQQAAGNATAANNTPKTTPPPAKSNEPAEGLVTAGRRADRAYSPFESTSEGLTQSLNFENNRGRLPWPVDAGIVTIPFGNYEIPNSKLRGTSEGIEIASKVGASVKAVADGEVSAVVDIGDGEQTVILIHGKYFTTYSHLSTVNVSKGDKVRAGTVLGKVAAGSDGEGQFTFMVNNEKGVALNPESWLKRR
jgi:septal ring factor EnvC (AmiA/AmiB activator)